MLHATKRLVDPKRRLQDLLLRCDELEQRLENAIANYFEHRKREVELLHSRMRSPREVLLRLAQQVGMLKTRLEAHWTRGLEARRADWARLTSVLDSLSPLKVVERGYSITFKDGKPVKSVEQIKKGDRLEITFAKGRAAAKVEEIL
jgi:exodeoxyribonuclease VII large subunit